MSTQLEQQIIDVLQRSPVPLMAKDIVAALHQDYRVNITKKEINPILYGPLSERLRQDPQSRWSLADGGTPRKGPRDHGRGSEVIGSGNGVGSESGIDGVLCPDCRTPMVLRTAKRGRNAGGQFYGCQNYPNCKGTRAFDPASAVAPPNVGVVSQPPSPDPPQHVGVDVTEPSVPDRPRRISAFESTPNTLSTFIECVGLPREAFASQVLEDTSESHLRALCQWQLDIPVQSSSGRSTRAVWITVVEKILKRGRAVPLSPTLEARIQRIAAPSESETNSLTLSRLAIADRPPPRWTHGFDSEEERLFVEQIMPAIAEHSLAGWILRQVALDPLVDSVDSEGSERKVDFLIAHPDGLQLVVEIDGEQHQQQAEADQQRDALLRAAGYDVIRIRASEVRNGSGAALDELRARLSGVGRVEPELDSFSFGARLRRAHQVQVALLHCITSGMFEEDTDRVLQVALSMAASVDSHVTDKFADAVISDLNELIGDAAKLYGESPLRFARANDVADADVRLDFQTDYTRVSPNTVFIRDVYLPLTIAAESVVCRPADAVEVDEATCEKFLSRIFGFDSFREGQFEAIARGLEGKDAIVLLPTGAGKSIAFQLTALLRPGICIVVDPIISLIEDQIENLRGFGIDRLCQITSVVQGAGQRDVMDALGRGEYFFCYVAPERFQIQAFRDSLRALTVHTPVALITIDEAHCVSEWGHDFRPAYLNIARISRDYCSTHAQAPPLMALTGTASRAVLKDVQRELEIDDFESIITPESFDRQELHFRTMSCHSTEKQARLRGLLEALPREFNQSAMTFFDCRGKDTHAGLVFCMHVNGKFGVVKVNEDVSKSLHRRTVFFSGTAPKGTSDLLWKHKKRRIAREFKRDGVPLMVCTKAFGMGIDKPNIRYTVHYGLPPSIESFYQEAGRAGRDRRDAHCVVLYSNDMPERTRALLNPALSVSHLHEQMESVNWDNADDITRVLWFHANSFGGIDSDYAHVVEVIDRIGDLATPRVATLEYPRGNDGKKTCERAVHRLLTIGVLSDYTVDYSANQIHAKVSGFSSEQILQCLYKYIAAYQRGQAKVAVDRLRPSLHQSHRDFVLRAALELIQFVYAIIERSRRQALAEVLALCEECPDEGALRNRLLRYLGTSGFTAEVERILTDSKDGLEMAVSTIESVRSAIDAKQLRGESGRALESYPDHPGLRLVRGISESLSGDANPDTVADNIEACVKFAMEKYGRDFSVVFGHLVVALRIAADAQSEAANPIVDGIIRGASDKREAARRIMHELPILMVGNAITQLVTELNSQLVGLWEGPG